jgi:hypothetical protein
VKPLPGNQSAVLSYVRSHAAERIQVLLNLTNEPQAVTAQAATVLLSSNPARKRDRLAGPLDLDAGEGLILLLD